MPLEAVLVDTTDQVHVPAAVVGRPAWDLAEVAALVGAAEEASVAVVVDGAGRPPKLGRHPRSTV